MCTIKLASRSAQACRSAATDMGATILHRSNFADAVCSSWMACGAWWNGPGMFCTSYLYLCICCPHSDVATLSLGFTMMHATLVITPLVIFVYTACVCVFWGVFLQFCFSSTSSSVLFLLPGSESAYLQRNPSSCSFFMHVWSMDCFWPVARVLHLGVVLTFFTACLNFYPLSIKFRGTPSNDQSPGTLQHESK